MLFYFLSFFFWFSLGKTPQAEVMGSRAAWALGEWPSLEVFVRGEHMQARRHIMAEGQGVESCLVLEAVVATQKGRLDEVRQRRRLRYIRFFFVFVLFCFVLF